MFNRCQEGLQLTVVALRIDLVVGKCGTKVITGINGFDGSGMLVDFLTWDAENGGWLWLEGQLLHPREAIDARPCANLQRLFCISPCIGRGEFKRADDVGMLEHEEVRTFGNLTVGKDFRFAKQETNEVEGMDVEV